MVAAMGSTTAGSAVGGSAPVDAEGRADRAVVAQRGGGARGREGGATDGRGESERKGKNPETGSGSPKFIRRR